MLRFSFVMITLTVSLNPVYAQVVTSTGNVVGPYQAVVNELKSTVTAQLEQKDIPGIAVALYDARAEWSWIGAFGSQDRAGTTPLEPDHVFRVGSISKLFTDIAIMQLVERGEVTLDDPVQKWIPEFQPKNPFGTAITLRQLMSHRSGLVRESPVGNYFDAAGPSLRDTVLSLNQTTLVYPPNTRTKYSNAGVAVVGYVIEKTQGVPFEAWMQQQILEPLGMSRSAFQLSDRIRPALAEGTMWSYDGRRFLAPTFPLGTLPAGNLYASATDLHRFLQELLKHGSVVENGLLRDASWEEMARPTLDADGKPLSYGLGFHLGKLNGYDTIGHGGAVYGFSTQITAIPEQGLGAIVFSTLDVSNGLVERLTEYALQMMMSARDNADLPAFRVSSQIPIERAKQLAGRYVSEQDQSMEIVDYGPDVFLHRGTYRTRLRMDGDALVSDDVFGWGPIIRRESQGDLVIDDQRYRKVESEAPAAAPLKWRDLIGEYGWDHNTLYVLEDHGQLYALIEWFFYYPLTEVTDDQFAFPDYGLYHGEGLRFQRDAAGRVVGVEAAEVVFPRRAVGTDEGQTFRITPIRPVEELRVEAASADPPAQSDTLRKPDLVEVTELDDSIQLDIRYATTNNFMGAVFYQQPRAFLQRPAAEALVRVHKKLEQRGYGLLIHDAYRPWYVTKMFWDATPESLRDFVANPANGSRHNRGCAVDLTLYDRNTGQVIPMVAGYDEFSNRSFPEYPGGTTRQRWHRKLLRDAMQSEGFTIYEFEWWHFDFQDWQQYPVINRTFEEL